MREKSLKAKVNRGKFWLSCQRLLGSEPVMRVTLGTAGHEHAFNAIVWRINRLPDKTQVGRAPCLRAASHPGESAGSTGRFPLRHAGFVL